MMRISLICLSPILMTDQLTLITGICPGCVNGGRKRWMMTEPIVDHQAGKAATLLQIAASDPERSVFVSANAGTGKTQVLTMRVLRLLTWDQLELSMHRTALALKDSSITSWEQRVRPGGRGGPRRAELAAGGRKRKEREEEGAAGAGESRAAFVARSKAKWIKMSADSKSRLYKGSYKAFLKAERSGQPPPYGSVRRSSAYSRFRTLA